MQRLSGLDASFLYLETSSQLLHVCGLVVVDPTTMPGGYAFHKLADELVTRIKVVPAFRRKLHTVPLDVDHPVWVEDHEFDIGNHLHRAAVPAPGGRAELCALLPGGRDVPAGAGVPRRRPEQHRAVPRRPRRHRPDRCQESAPRP